MKHLSIIFGILLFSVTLINCGDNSGPGPGEDFDPSGTWVKLNTPSFSLVIGLLEGQPDDKIIFCDQSINGIGCALGEFTDEGLILMDNPDFPDLKVEDFNNTIRISPVDGVSQTFTGTFERADWGDGSCGLYLKSNNRIGPLENNCVVGEWYSFIRDPFSGESKIIYKNYLREGEGQLIIPHENKNITFDWFTTNDSRGDIIHETNFSDQSDDKEYAYICTEEGLALGNGGSWIRNNIQCLF